MDNQTTISTKASESTLFGVSLRGIVVVLIVVTICIMSVLTMKVEEPLYTLGSLVVGYYFGQNKKQQV